MFTRRIRSGSGRGAGPGPGTAPGKRLNVTREPDPRPVTAIDTAAGSRHICRPNARTRQGVG